MKVWAINTSAPDKYGGVSSPNGFLVNVNNTLMNFEQYFEYYKENIDPKAQVWDAAKEFNEARFNAISNNYNILQTIRKNLRGKRNGKFGFSLPTLTTFFDSLNENAVRQVLSGPAYENWKLISKMFHSGDMEGRKLLSLDTETFGDVQYGRRPFAITEIGIGELQFNGPNSIGDYLGNEKGYGSFVIGLNVKQQEYVQSIIKKMEESSLGYDVLNEDEKLVARRMSMYSNVDAFKKLEVGAFFDPDSSKRYWVANHLSNETVTVERVKAGLQRFKMLADAQTREGTNPLRGIIDYLVSIAKDTSKKYLLYGATSEFDIGTIVNAMIVNGYDDSDIAMVRSLGNSIADVTHVLQAAAAVFDKDVASFQQDILKTGYAGASMDEQVPNFHFSGKQEHQAFWDGFTEGKSLVHHVTEVFDKFLDEDSNDKIADIRKQIKKTTIGSEDQLRNARFFIRSGTLDYRNGNEFAINSYYNASGVLKERAVPQATLAGQWWQIDFKRTFTGTYNDNGVEKQKYILTLTNAADYAQNASSRRTKIADGMQHVVFMFDSEAELDRRVSELLKKSTIEIVTPKTKAAFETKAVSTQMHRYWNIGHKEIERLMSPSEVRLNSNKYTTSYGFSQLKDALELYDKIRSIPDFSKRFPILSGNGEDGNGINYEDFYSRRGVMELESAIEEVTGAGRNSLGELESRLVKGGYQTEAFLSIIDMFDNQYDIHKYLIKQVDTAFEHLPQTAETDILKTAAYREALETTYKKLAPSFTIEDIADLLYDNPVQARSDDKYGIDIMAGNDVDFYRADFTGGTSTATNGIKKALSTVDDEEDLYRLLGNPDEMFNPDMAGAEYVRSNSRTLLGRGLIDGEQARSIIRHFRNINRNDYMLSQEIAEAISKNVDFNNGTSSILSSIPGVSDPKELFKKYPRIFKSEAYDSLISVLSEIKDTDFFSDTELLTNINDIINRISLGNFSQIDSRIFQTKIVDGVTEIIDDTGAGIVDEILDYLNVQEEGVGPKHLLISQMFDSKKDYSIGQNSERGLQAFLIKPDDVIGKPHEGKDIFLLLTNSEHVGPLTEFITSEKGIEAAQSYRTLRESEATKHSILFRMPHINKRYVDKYGNAIVSVKQGDSYERILLPNLRMWTDKNDKSFVFYNDAEYDVLSLFRMVGRSLGDYAVEGDFVRGNKLAHKPFDKLMADSPGFSSYFGLPYEPQYTPNDIMRAYEVQAIEGAADIFEKAALAGADDIDARNLNPAQQIVIDFIALQKGEYPIHVFDEGHLRKQIRETLNSDPWKEFFRRRFVTGHIADETWSLSGIKTQGASVEWGNFLSNTNKDTGGAYKGPNPGRYDYTTHSFFEIIREMATNPSEEDNLGSYDRAGNFVPFVDSESAVQAFANFPTNMSVISPVGSKSQTERGSIFFGTKIVNGTKEFFRRTFGDYQLFSGLYNQMRPLYAQQGSPMPYGPEDIHTPTPFTIDLPDDEKIDSLKLLNHTVNIDGTEIDMYPAIFDSTAIEEIELEAKDALKNGNDIVAREHEFILRTKAMSNLELAEKLNSLKSNEVMTRVLEKYENLGRRDPGYLFDVYNDIADQVARDFGSLYEDKGLLSPVIKYQRLFQKKDSTNFSMDWSRVDIPRTVEDLTELGKNSVDSSGNVVIRYGDIIGRRKNGIDIIYTKSDIYIPQEQFAEFIKNSDTEAPQKIRVNTAGDIVDDKTMLFGLEKHTTHSIDIKAVAEILKTHTWKYDSDELVMDEALRISQFMYEEISDNAALILNAKMMKHGGIAGLEGQWNTISTRYTINKELPKLINILNNDPILKPFTEPLASNGNPAFRIDPRTGRMISNFSQIRGQAAFLEALHSVIEKSTDKSAKEAIAIIKYNSEKSIIDATAHRQFMNDHTGTSMLIDLREQQAILLRGMTREEGLNPSSKAWLKAFKDYAYSYDGTYSYDNSVYDSQYVGAFEKQLSSKTMKVFERIVDGEKILDFEMVPDGFSDSTFRRAADKYSRALNYNRTIYNAHQRDAMRTLKGMVESYRYFNDKKVGIEDIRKKDIVIVPINDIINATGNRVDSGIDLDTKTLNETLFFIDGKPSNYITRLAEKQGISQERLVKGSYSIFIDMGDYRPTNFEDGFLLPLQNISHIEGDRTLFKQAPTDFIGFIRKIVGIIRDNNEASTSSRLGNAYRDYINNKIIPQTNLIKKDSDLFKTIQQFVAPNSAELFAQDEAAPLLRNWSSERYQRDGLTVLDLIEKKAALDVELFGDPDNIAYDLSKMDEYRDIVSKISSISKQMAEDARANNDIAGEIMSLGYTEDMRTISKVIGKDGKTYQGIVGAVGEEGLKALGLDLGEVGSNVIRAYEMSKGELDKAYLEGLDRIQDDIASAIYQLRDGIGPNGNVKPLKAIMEEEALDLIEKYTYIGHDKAIEQLPQFEFAKGKTLAQDISHYIDAVNKTIDEINNGEVINVPFNTRDLNENIEKRLYRRYHDAVYDTKLGHAFMAKVGTFAEFGRFPIFQSQPIIRLVLDETVEGKHIRITNPVASLISNLDFDGDKLFLALRLNGSSVLPQTSKEFKLLQNIYSDITINDVPKLLGEAIESGDGFKTENPNDWIGQLGHLYQIIDDKNFTKSAIQYTRKTLEEYENASDDVIEKALKQKLFNDKTFFTFLLHSKEIVEGFKDNVGDTTRLEAVETAAITSRFRMESIGSISTPAFKLRSTLHTVLQTEQGLTPNNKELLNNLLLDLSHMDTKSGGLLSFAEQNAIDAKFIKDTNVLSRAQEFSKHTYALLRNEYIKGSDAEARRAANLTGMVRALGSNVINTGKLSEREFVDKYIIIETDELLKIIEEVKGRGENAESFELALGLNRLHKAVREIPQVSWVYNNFIGAQTIEALRPWLDQYKNLSESQKRIIVNNRIGTPASPELEEVLQASSSDKFPFVKGQVIGLGPGIADEYDIDYEYKDRLYWISDITNTDKNKWKMHLTSLEDPSGKLDTTISAREADRIIVPEGEPILEGEYKINGEIRDQVTEYIESSKVKRALDFMTQKDPHNFTFIKELNSGSIPDPTLRYVIERIKDYSGTDTEEVASEQIARRMRNLFDTYSYIMSQNSLSYNAYNTSMDGAGNIIAGGHMDNTGANLLRQINNNIASKINKTIEESPDDILPLDVYYAEEIATRLHMTPDELNEQVSNISSKMRGYPKSFSLSSYSKHIDLLQKNVYDIVGEVNTVKAALDEVTSVYGQVRPDLDSAVMLSNILKDKDAIIQRTYEDAIRHNFYNGVYEAQANVYNMLSKSGTFSLVAENVFNWKASEQGDRLIGFGTYMGKPLKSLNVDDITAVKKEAEWLSANINFDKWPQLKIAINRSLEILDGYTPTATDSIFKSSLAAERSKATSQAVINAQGFLVMAKETLDIQGLADKLEKAQREPIDFLNNVVGGGNNLQRRTLSNEFFEQAKQTASKITSQQVVAGIAALAGIGIINKLLHDDRRRSPLEAGRSGAKQPPIINGKSINNSGAPSTRGFERTVYHDNQSGLDFQVSASTNKRLSDISSAKAINVAGGGNTQIYAFNDTRGISDNWLANKFAELSE